MIRAMIDAYCIDDATLTTFTKDKWNKRTAAVSAITGLAEINSHQVRDQEGAQVVSSGTYITKAAVKVGDRLAIGGVDYSAIRVDPSRVFGADPFWKVHLV